MPVAGKLSTELLGLTLRSPFVLGSGPLSYDGHGLVRAHHAGAGAVTTKTIRDSPARNPYPHIAMAGRDSMINSEKWSDITGDAWVNEEIPRAKAAGAIVIGSIGHSLAEVRHWVARVDAAGADIIELVSYGEREMLSMVRLAKRQSHKPVIVKLSPNWRDPLSCARAVLTAGADGLTAMDSVGPVLRLDIETGKPLVGGPRGFGWLSGAAIKPIVLRHVAEIAGICKKPIIGIGGVMTAEDALEMLMAGASAVGVCTAPMVKGLGHFARLNEGLARLLERLSYDSVASASRAALPHLNEAEELRPFDFVYKPELCTSCNACVRACPYAARALEVKAMSVSDECRHCGLCASVCPTAALSLKGP